MKVENEYEFEPTADEYGFALSVQKRLTPQPQIEFIAQPAGFYGWVNYFFRFTNPNNGKHEDCGVELSMRPAMLSVLIGSLAAIGFAPVPAPPARARVVIAPNTAMPDPKPGQVMGLIAPTGPTA